MVDVSRMNDNLPQMDSGVDLLPPGQPAEANGHGVDIQDDLNELFNINPHCLPSTPLVIGSDTDSDLSDDEDDIRQSHHQEPVSLPGRLIRSPVIAHTDHDG